MGVLFFILGILESVGDDAAVTQIKKHLPTYEKEQNRKRSGLELLLLKLFRDHALPVIKDMEDAQHGHGNAQSRQVPVLQNDRDTIKNKINKNTINYNELDDWIDISLFLLDNHYINGNQINKFPYNKINDIFRLYKDSLPYANNDYRPYYKFEEPKRFIKIMREICNTNRN